jgi:hypothetical protein
MAGYLSQTYILYILRLFLVHMQTALFRIYPLRSEEIDQRESLTVSS